MSDLTQLARLARPVPKKYVKQLPGRGNADYVAHSVITEILLMVVGPFDWHVEPVTGKDGAIIGCLGHLGCTIDGRYTQITEVGDTTGQEADEGGALKNAASDALKRAAMRLGLGLSLWARDGYFLFDQLTKPEGGGRPEPTSAEGAESDPGLRSPSDAPSELAADPCQECGRDQLPLAELGGHAPTCSRRPL